LAGSVTSLHQAIIIIIIITKEQIKVMPSQLQSVTGALYNTLSPVTHQGMTVTAKKCLFELLLERGK